MYSEEDVNAKALADITCTYIYMLYIARTKNRHCLSQCEKRAAALRGSTEVASLPLGATGRHRRAMKERRRAQGSNPGQCRGTAGGDVYWPLLCSLQLLALISNDISVA